MFNFLENIIISLATNIHLAFFAPIVSFVEELIPPIPSPSVMIATGYMAQVQGYLFFGLMILVFLAAIGKTLGAGLVYYLIDKAEDLLSNKIFKFIGLNHKQIESFGARLSKDWRDYIILTALRAMPVIPSSLLSVGCGFLKINFKLFIITTFIGSIIRDFIYIYLGFTGTKVAISLFKESTATIEFYIQIFIVLVIVVILGFFYFKQKRGKVY